jgi:hypothetical protein
MPGDRGALIVGQRLAVEPQAAKPAEQIGMRT